MIPHLRNNFEIPNLESTSGNAIKAPILNTGEATDNTPIQRSEGPYFQRFGELSPQPLNSDLGFTACTFASLKKGVIVDQRDVFCKAVYAFSGDP